MIPAGFLKRPNAAFLSYAHADGAKVDLIAQWLQSAGIPFWYDRKDLPASASIVSELPRAIASSRALILILSKTAIQKGWVDQEYNCAVGERAQNEAFRIIPVRLDDCEVPGFLRTTRWLDLNGRDPSLEFFEEIVTGLHGSATPIRARGARDIYISLSWRDTGNELNERVCHHLIDAGFRLVGDLPRGGFDEESIARIMRNCGAMVAIPPHRGNGTTSSYILREIAIAQRVGIPVVAVSDPEVQLPAGLPSVRIGEADNAIQDLDESWTPPQQPHYVFHATSFAAERKPAAAAIANTVERLTGLECRSGDGRLEAHIQQAIAADIAHTQLVIADITGNNLNTCIEAGIAIGAQRDLKLVSADPRDTKKPFAFRDKQIHFYRDDAELLALVYSWLDPLRRRIFNYELFRQRVA